MSREAMQMALEALEDANDVARMEFSDEDYYGEAIAALRQALETEREWVGLTDDAVFELADTNLYDGGKNFGVLAFAKAIEQALKEKNHG